MQPLMYHLSNCIFAVVLTIFFNDTEGTVRNTQLKAKIIPFGSTLITDTLHYSFHVGFLGSISTETVRYKRINCRALLYAKAAEHNYIVIRLSKNNNTNEHTNAYGVEMQMPKYHKASCIACTYIMTSK